jgi:hypothetical protein
VLTDGGLKSYTFSSLTGSTADPPMISRMMALPRKPDPPVRRILYPDVPGLSEFMDFPAKMIFLEILKIRKISYPPCKRKCML